MKWKHLSADCMIHTFNDDQRRHRFPLRWAGDGDGVRVVTFYLGIPPAAFVPTRCKSVRVSNAVLAADFSKPVREGISEFGSSIQDGRMVISASASALKIASSSAFSCWPLATASSTPPWFLEAWSIEYFLATAFQRLAALERALASSALAFVLVRTMRRSRRSGWAKRALFLS